MNIIIDTHIFLWLIFDPEKIDDDKLIELKDRKNSIFITSISLWEISLKFAIGKLELEGIKPDNLIDIAKRMNIDVLDIDKHSMATYCNLPKIKKHNDPFDRIIIWFCINNSYKLISQDKKFLEYQSLGLVTT